MTAAIIISLLAFIIAFNLNFPIWTSISLTWLGAGLSILASSNTNLMINFWLVISEYRYHRFEFYKHYKKQIALMVVTYMSMMILLFGSLAASTTSFCISKNDEMGAFY